MTDPIPSTVAGGHRLFFALWPDDETRVALERAVANVAMFRGAGRRTSPSKYHLTLHFLGGWATRPDDVADRARVAAANVEARAFHLVLDRAGGFPGPRVGWLAPAGNSGLDALWCALRHALDDASIEHSDHGKFSPHVTVLRGVAGRLPETPIEPVSWPVTDFVLVYGFDGRYEILERWPLRA